MPLCELIEYTATTELCEYGCGNLAQHAFIVKKNKGMPSKNSTPKIHICCSIHYNKCPVKKNNQSAKMSGSGNSMFGKKHTSVTIDKMQGPRPSMAGENHHRWGKTFVHKLSSKRLISISTAKSSKAYWYKTLSGRAFGMFFRSSFELFFIVQNYPNIRNNEGNDAILINYSGHRHYKPDFFIDNKLIEIKPKFAKNDEVVKAKEQAAKLWCQNNQHVYEMVTEDNIEFNFERVEHLVSTGEVTFNRDGLNRFRKMRPAYEKRFNRRLASR